MFKLSHLIAALIATVPIASPLKLAPSDSQVPLRVSVLQPYNRPPPPCGSILLAFNDAICTMPEAAVYAMTGNTCYYLPDTGADLVYQQCSQTTIFNSTDCSTGGVALPLDTCTDVSLYYSIFVTCP